MRYVIYKKIKINMNVGQCAPFQPNVGRKGQKERKGEKRTQREEMDK